MLNFEGTFGIRIYFVSADMLAQSPPDGAVIILPSPSSSSPSHRFYLCFAQLASVAGSVCGRPAERALSKGGFTTLSHTHTDLQLRCQTVARGFQAGALHVQSVTSKAPVSDTR